MPKLQNIRKYFDSSDSIRIVNALIELIGEEKTGTIADAYTKSIDLPVEEVSGTFGDNLYGQTIYEEDSPKSYKLNVSHTPYWEMEKESGISSRKFISDPYFKEKGATSSWRLPTYPKTTAEHESVHGIMRNIYGTKEKGTPFARTETVPYYIQALALKPYYPELKKKFGKKYSDFIINRNEELIKELKKLSVKEYEEFIK